MVFIFSYVQVFWWCGFWSLEDNWQNLYGLKFVISLGLFYWVWWSFSFVFYLGWPRLNIWAFLISKFELFLLVFTKKIFIGRRYVNTLSVFWPWFYVLLINVQKMVDVFFLNHGQDRIFSGVLVYLVAIISICFT